MFEDFQKLLAKLLANLWRKGIDRVDPFMLLGVGFGLRTFIHRFHIRRRRAKEDDIARLLSTLSSYYAKTFVTVDAELIVWIDQHRNFVGLAEQSPSIGIHLLPFPFCQLTVLFSVEVVL